jgi:hypothetical protein
MGLGGDTSNMDVAQLRNENDRLQNTIMILNQKMKISEDNEDLNEKWKAQIQSKEGQIEVLKDQNDTQ